MKPIRQYFPWKNFVLYGIIVYYSLVWTDTSNQTGTCTGQRQMCLENVTYQLLLACPVHIEY